MIMRIVLSLAVFVWLLSATAIAEESVLADNGDVAVSFENLETDAHFIHYVIPEGWDKAFIEDIAFYGQRYGDVGSIRGTVVVWVPSAEQHEHSARSLEILDRMQFPLADVPEEGWFSLDLEANELPTDFWVSVFTYSNEERGVSIGLAEARSGDSASSQGKPGLPDSDDATLDYRNDGLDWMIRTRVRSTVMPSELIVSDDLTGNQFAYYDDGLADEFTTTQKNGPMIRITNSEKRILDRVYVYAKVEGDWFNSSRSAEVYLMDPEFRIIYHRKLPYTNFNAEPSWSYIEFPAVEVPEMFYVLVTPTSRPQVSMQIGYDLSGANKASLFGTPGAQLRWALDAPEQITNWMIRVRYSK